MRGREGGCRGWPDEEYIAGGPKMENGKTAHPLFFRTTSSAEAEAVARAGRVITSVNYSTRGASQDGKVLGQWGTKRRTVGALGATCRCSEQWEPQESLGCA